MPTERDREAAKAVVSDLHEQIDAVGAAVERIVTQLETVAEQEG
jgi:hypothetical protein